MHEAIASFIEDVFSPEFIGNVRRAFSLFEAFDHQNAYNKMLDAVHDESVENTETRADRFTVALADELSFIVKEHCIALTDETTIADMLVIADGLYRLQHMEDYTAILSILNSPDDAVDQMSLILEEITDYDQGRLLTLLQSVEPKVLKSLGQYIDEKTPKGALANDAVLINRIRLFNTVFGEEHVGHVLLDAGMRAGYEFSMYLPYVKDELIQGSPEQVAKNILSVLYLSSVPNSEIVTAFRATSEELLPSLEAAGNIEHHLVQMLSQLDERQKALHEEARLLEERGSK